MAKRKPAWLAFVTAHLAAIQAGSFPNGRVLVESPYAGNVRRNRAYLKACLRDSLARGEFPLASHAIYTQVLDDTNPDQRLLGIKSGLAWGTQADATVVYRDLGISFGMEHGIVQANLRGRPVVFRSLGGRWKG